jgi:RHS repeat-associated protein
MLTLLNPIVIRTKPMKYYISLCFLLASVNILYSQNVETVKSKVITSTPDKSYIVNDYGVIQNTTISGANGPFFLRANPSAFRNDNHNFVQTEVIKQSGVTTDDGIRNLPLDKRSTSISIVDGAGRKLQDIAVQSSPTQKDVIATHVFNTFGVEQRSYLPYTTGATPGVFRPSAQSEQGQFYSSPPSGVSQESSRPFNENVLDDSPLNRIEKSFGPGGSWYTQDKAVVTKTLVYSSGDVLKWSYNGSNSPSLPSPNPPSLVGFYASNLLTYQEAIDEQGLITRVYSNFLGQKVLERKGTEGNFHDTYFIYDYVGNVFCVIPPEATAIALGLNVGSGVLAYRDQLSVSQRQTFLNDWAFQYEYDNFQRLIEKKIPGGQWSFMVYDKWDRLVLTQDGNGDAGNRWMFTKYDQFNRAIITGIYNSSASRTSLQTDVDNYYVTHPEEYLRYEVRFTNALYGHGYTIDRSFPVNPSEANLLTISYFDDHDFKNYPNWDAEGNNFTYVQENDLPAAGNLPATVKGHATGSKVKVLGTSQWINNISYYDKKYNLIQVINENHLNGKDRISSYVDFAGQATKILRTHTSSGGSFSLLEENTFDHAGRLLKTEHTLDGQKVILTANVYNELGQLIEKNLHSVNGGASYLQSVDYRYNIRGWLTHINNTSFSSDANNNDTNDLFGMELLYHAPVLINGFTPSFLYNGNISAIKWKTSNLIDSPKEKVFGFGYDSWNRLTSALFATNNGTTFAGDAGMYNSSYSYDRNGNLITLSRHGKTSAGTEHIDLLSYEYASGNTLMYVNDSKLDAFGTKGYGFTEKSELTAASEYLYDFNGNVTGDMNKGTDITYNHLNMPTLVEFDDGNHIEYVYDALGNKIKQKVFQGSTVIAERDYIGGAHFEDGILKFLANKEGRAIKDGSSWFYEYHLRDHQNNVMVAFGALEEANVYKADMEPQPPEHAMAEQNTFRNILGRREGTYNHTRATAEMPAPNTSVWTNGGSPGGEIGPAKIIPINSGDRLKMEVFARYVTPGSGPSQDILGSLVDLTRAGLGIVSGEAAYAAFGSQLGGIVGSVVSNGSSPLVYLNYIVFNSTFTDYRFGYKPVSLAASNGFEKLALEITVPAGFNGGNAYIYTTNESNYYAYFDDILIVHEKTNLVPQVTQTNDYYPFGLSFNSYQKESITPNRYLYQNQENQDDLLLEDYQYKFRMHDPSMGRFLSVDPLAEKFYDFGTYSFSGNRVVDAVELEGAEPLIMNPEYSSYIAQNSSNWDYGYLTGTYDYASHLGSEFVDWMKAPWINFAEGGMQRYENQFQYQQNLNNPYIPQEVSTQIKSTADARADSKIMKGAAGIANQSFTFMGAAYGGVQGTSNLNFLSRGNILGGSSNGFGFMRPGSGPVSGVLEVSNNVRSVSAFRNYSPGNGIEFIFDKSQNVFLVGKPNISLGGSPHQQLVRSIGADGRNIVGGMFNRGANGEIILNQHSGHYWMNWNGSIKNQLQLFMQNKTGQSVIIH